MLLEFYFILGHYLSPFQVVYGDVYLLDDEMKWKELPSMPKPDSHIEFAWAIVNRSIIIAGGTTDKHPVTKKMVLNGELFRYELDKQVTLYSPSTLLWKELYDDIFFMRDDRPIIPRSNLS